MEHRIFLTSDLVSLLRVSRSTIDRWTREAREGKSEFPVPISAPGRRKFWDARAIEAWLAEKNRAPPQVGVPPGRSEKQKARDFAERQQRAQQALERHGLRKGGTQSK